MNKKHDNSNQFKAEPFTLEGAGAVGDVRVGDKPHRHIRSHEPIVVQVMDSVLEGGKHTVSMTVANQTIHGMYIESLNLEKPKDTNLVCMEREKVSGHLNIAIAPEVWVEHEWAPKYIPPGRDVYFAIAFPEVARKKKEVECGRLTLSVSRLEKDGITCKTCIFRIRHQPSLARPREKDFNHQSPQSNGLRRGGLSFRKSGRASD